MRYSSKEGIVPDEEGPWSGGDVCFLDIVVNRGRPSNDVDVRAQEQEIHNDIDDFEEDTVFPAVRHGARGEESSPWPWFQLFVGPPTL